MKKKIKKIANKQKKNTLNEITFNKKNVLL